MLKTLEEPPDYLKFVLATTDPQKVPVTVLSRCLQFNLRPMAPETIREHLERVLRAEAVPADAPSLRLLARAARGSMRDALSLTDQAIAFGAGSLSEVMVRLMLGSVDRAHVFGLLRALAQGDGKTVVETAEVLRLHGLSAATALEDMAAVLQSMAVMQAVPAGAVDTDPDASELAQLAAEMPADETHLLYSLCLHGRAELGLAPDEYAALTMVLLRLLAFKPAASAPLQEKKSLTDGVLRPQATVPVVPAVSASTLARQGRQLPVLDATALAGAKPGNPVAMPVAAVDQPAQRGRLDAIPVRVQADTRADDVVQQNGHALQPTEEGEFWHATVTQLIAQDAVTALVRELALQSQLVARDTDQWLLRVERESLNQAGARDRLSAALQGAGHAVQLAVEVGRVSDSPARRNASALAERQLASEKIIFDDPFVQSLMRDFGAKIVPGSIKSGG
jgi:DNA polymerase-3 subunit gamma/tau